MNLWCQTCAAMRHHKDADRYVGIVAQRLSDIPEAHPVRVELCCGHHGLYVTSRHTASIMRGLGEPYGD